MVDLTARTSTAPARRGDTGPLGHQGRGSRVRGRRSRGPLALMLILALAVLLSGAAWFIAEGPLSKTTTPGLLNLSVAEAKAKAADSGLEAAVKGHGFSEVVPVGLVLETDPGRGEDIDNGGTIGLILSKGPERYAVPNVVDRTEEVARSMIEDGHLTVGDVERKYSSKVEEGVVISADPEAGTELKRDQAVTLVVSRGAQPVAVPNVVGLPVDQAKVAVTEAKLRPEVTEKFHETVPLGTVIRQTPEGGTADKNSVLELVVSKGPPLVEVPGVIGKNVAEAQQLVAAAGLVPSVSQLPGGPGTVLNQSPGGGDKQPKGSTVTLYVF